LRRTERPEGIAVAAQTWIRVGRQVSYKESATVYRSAIITAVAANGYTVTLTVFTDANADGVTRVQNVDARPTAGKLFKQGIGTGSQSV
jgi:hypothetical protein